MTYIHSTYMYFRHTQELVCAIKIPPFGQQPLHCENEDTIQNWFTNIVNRWFKIKIGWEKLKNKTKLWTPDFCWSTHFHLFLYLSYKLIRKIKNSRIQECVNLWILKFLLVINILPHSSQEKGFTSGWKGSLCAKRREFSENVISHWSQSNVVFGLISNSLRCRGLLI